MLKEKFALVTVFFWLCQSTNILGFPENEIEEIQIPGIFTNSCYEDLGCFYTGPPFFQPPVIPINAAPWSPEKMRTKFLLFTPTQKDQGYLLKPTKESLQGSSFNESLDTKILIYGYWTFLMGDDQFTVMKDTFLAHGDYNVIIVDWWNSNHGTYIQAAANARMAGAQIGQIVRFLQRERNITPCSVHIIGHSLGAQAAGYAGQSIPNLGRITGLDAAAPLFEGTHPDVHLDHTDAQFVDGIHSQAGGTVLEGFGFVSAYADIDFYPNGGKHQPKCKRESANGTRILTDFICNHMAATDYFIESIQNENCQFVGTECDIYQHYLDGECDSYSKAVMGIRARPTPGLGHLPGRKFYLRTSDVSPYCITER